MAKDKAVYAPGELSRVRNNLGNVNADEAKRMAELLGGEVGVEKSVTPEKTGYTSEGQGNHSKSQPMRRIEILPDDADEKPIRLSKKSSKGKKADPEDDPAISVNPSYLERIKMDRFAAQTNFEIKSIFQLPASYLSIFKKNPDFVNPGFITQKMVDYYKKIESLVASTRTLFPRNNIKNNEQLRKMSPFMFSVLDIIRHWNIERISSDMARMQSRPKAVKCSDFSEILRAVYKPLFILGQLDLEVHIKGSYKLLYKILYIDNPIDAKDKYQELIRSSLASYEVISKEIHYLLYPLLMKLLSDKWLPYHRFFLERKNRIMAFLNVTEKDCISPENMAQIDEKSLEESDPKNEAVKVQESTKLEEDPEAAARQAANEAERKALERGLRTLEALFPQAGWDKLDTYPDLYGYFAKVLDLKKGYELIAPTDPLLQVAILMRIMEELVFGLRYVSFEIIEGVDGHLEEIVNGWRDYETNFTQEYLARLIEYCQLLESSADSRTSNYAKRLYAELQWIKRLCFLPHYRFDNVVASSIKKSTIPPLYPEIRRLRKYLTIVASGIEQGSKQGGAEKQAVCKGINNPWAPYNFQVANPLSLRLNALLGQTKRNNASLVYFTLSVVTVLDYFVNNEDSWAYGDNSGTLFRSINGEGIIPQFGVDDKIDADALFKQVMKARKKEPNQE